jgi:hypothetical protein
MGGAGSRDSTWHDLAAFRNKITNGFQVFIVNNRFLVGGAEPTDLFAGKNAFYGRHVSFPVYVIDEYSSSENSFGVVTKIF